MFGSTVLEVAIGMVFVFLLVSLVCSGISDRISDLLKWRASDLEKGIRDLLLDGNQELLYKLYNSPLIQSLATIKNDKVPSPSTKAALAQGDAKQGEPVPKNFPISIPARTFVLALFDAFVPKEAGGVTEVTDLRNAIQTKMSDSIVKTQLLALVTGADEKIEASRKNVEQWFNAAEAQMTKMYKENMWKISFFIGLGVSVFLNADTTAIAGNLWHDPTLRAAVVAQATQYATSKEITATNAISQTVAQINSLNLPIGWQVNRDSKKFIQCLVPANWIGFDWCFGPTDWVDWVPSANATVSSANVAATPSFPWFSSFVLKVIGWFVTAFAGAQGAPFWFDILRKLTEKGSPPK